MSPSWCVSKNKLLPIAILCPNRTDSFFLLIFLFAFYNIHCNASQLWHFVLMVSKTFCFEISRLGVFIQIYLTVGMINDCKAKMYKAWMASSNSSLHIVRVVTYGTYFCWDVRMSRPYFEPLSNQIQYLISAFMQPKQCHTCLVNEVRNNSL